MSILVVSGPVIVEGRKALVVKHGDTPFWKFCGGGVEEGDVSLLAACERRAKEELGIELEFVSKEPWFLYTKKTTPEGEMDIILVHYLAKVKGEIQPGKDIREWTWLPIDRMEENALAPNIKPALKHFGFIGE